MMDEIDGEDSGKTFIFHQNPKKPQNFIDDLKNSNGYINDIPNKVKSRFKNMKDLIKGL